MRSLIFAFLLVAAQMTPNCAKADRRVAFVVGNGAYQNMDQLSNPPVSAKSMAALLRNVGFEVVEGIDLARDDMNRRLSEFAGKAKAADLALFYYCGRGIAVDGSNYLVPVDADIKSAVDARLGGAINVDAAIDQTMSDSKVRLIFLDASRDNPLAEKGGPKPANKSGSGQIGLAPVREGTLIGYATGPGQIALDGEKGAIRPFTRALIDNIAVSGAEIQQAMTKVRAQVSRETKGAQMPWGHTYLVGDIYLNPVAVPSGR